MKQIQRYKERKDKRDIETYRLRIKEIETDLER